MTRPLVVAIDSSTTACKALAFDASGSAVAVARVALSKTSPEPGWQEQDASDWWTAAREALAELMAQLVAADVVALSVTHQRETFVCLDEHDEALRPAILWLDTRASSQVRRLGSKRMHEVSGKPPSTTPSLYKLAWLADHEPEVLHRTSMIADVHAYLVRKLTGRWVTSWASADPLNVVDMRTFEYAPELLAAVGLSAGQFPRLVAPGVIIGEVTDDAAHATGLPAGLPVVAGAGDGQCAGLGAAICEEGRAYLNLGTGITPAVTLTAITPVSRSGRCRAPWRVAGRLRLSWRAGHCHLRGLGARSRVTPRRTYTNGCKPLRPRSRRVRKDSFSCPISPAPRRPIGTRQREGLGSDCANDMDWLTCTVRSWRGPHSSNELRCP